MLWLALLLASQGVDGEAVSVKLSILEDVGVGGVKKGLLCVPAGSLKAGDIAFPEPPQVAGRLGVGATEGQIVGIEANLCTAYMGVGKPPHSRLTVSVTWRTGASASGGPCEAPFDGQVRAKDRDLRTDPTVMLDAIEQAFRAWRAAGC